MSETWKDIPGFEGLYQASTFGRIRTAPGKTTFSKRYGRARHWKTRILKGRGQCKSGYKVALWRDGKPFDYLVHRAVALTWVPGFVDGMTVNHINGDRFDNRVENLEWLSLKENIQHGFLTGLYPTRPVTLIDSQGVPYTFNSCANADRFLGRSVGYLSGRLCAGRKRASGYEIRAHN